MKRILLSVFTCLLLAVAIAQPKQAKEGLTIQLNKYILQPGDSLAVTAAYKDAGGKVMNLPLATLELIFENEQGNRTRLRWPMINGQASGKLYLPDSLPRGKYTVLAGLQQRFFEVVGKIQNVKNGGSLQAMLLTKTGDWDTQEVPVEPDGTFTVRNWLFEDNAVMAFSWLKNSSQPLDIRISTRLDSTYEPFAITGQNFYIGNPPTAVRVNELSKAIQPDAAVFADQGALLPGVVVKGTNKSRAQQFNDEYSSGLFKSGDERIVSILDDPSAISFPNIFSYLQGRVAGLQIYSAGFNGGRAIWRGNPVTFFIDEVRADPQQVANIPVADIAIVKAYPPPFFGAPGGGSGGGIAIYTRRGGEAEYLSADKHVFRVKGYTPSTTVLNMNKLNL